MDVKGEEFTDVGHVQEYSGQEKDRWETDFYFVFTSVEESEPFLVLSSCVTTDHSNPMTPPQVSSRGTNACGRGHILTDWMIQGVRVCGFQLVWLS